jgi:HAD superfamily hydrolase (TIGR01509 family)
MIKSILFDWDGTILNTLPYWLEAYRKTFSSFSVNPRDEEIVQKVFGDRLGHRQYGINDDEAFFQMLTTNVQDIVMSSALHDNIEITLKSLQDRGFSLVLLTSSPKVLIHRDLKRYEMESYFSKVITDEDLTHHRPHPEGILKALSAFQITTREALIVGDSDKDIDAGRAAGIQTVLFYPEVNVQFYPESLVKRWNPDHIIDSYSKLIPLLTNFT